MQDPPRKVLYTRVALAVAGVSVAIATTLLLRAPGHCADSVNGCTVPVAAVAPTNRDSVRDAEPGVQALRVATPASAELDAVAASLVEAIDPDGEAVEVVSADELNAIEDSLLDGDSVGDDDDGDGGDAAEADAGDEVASDGAETDTDADQALASDTDGDQETVDSLDDDLDQLASDGVELAITGSVAEPSVELEQGSGSYTVVLPGQVTASASLENWYWPWPGTEQHGESVARASCDAHDAVRINQASQLYLLGDPSIRVFCLAPGNYSGAVISTVNAVSGSANLPRVVQLDSDILDTALGVAEAADTALATLPPLTLIDSDHWHFVGVRWQAGNSAPLSLLRSDGVLLDRVRIALDGAGVSVSDSDNWRLQRSLVTAADGSATRCVEVTLHADDVLAVTNAEFRGCERGLHVSVANGAEGSEVLVAGNEFHRSENLIAGCDVAGLWVDGGGALTIDDNQFSGWVAPSDCADPVGAAVVLGENLALATLDRNVIWQSSTGVVIRDNAGSVTVQDTVIAGDGTGVGVHVGLGNGDIELSNNHFVRTASWLDSQRSTVTVSCNAIASSGYPSVPAGGPVEVTLNSYFDALPGALAGPLGLDQVAVLGPDDFEPLCLASSALSSPQTFCVSGAARNPATVDCGSDFWVN